MAPEFIAVVLGPRWGGVVLPFRMFSISLLFRMSSKISDACTKAAGEVFIRAILQYVYAGSVVLGAILGQRWGVGGVAVAVSLAMALNWLSMAWLGRKVTGLSWARFARAHVPAALLAAVIGLGSMVVAGWARSAQLGIIVVLAVTGLAAAAVALAAAKLSPALFLGAHGTWAVDQGQSLRGRMSRRTARAAAAEEVAAADELAAAGEAKPR